MPVEHKPRVNQFVPRRDVDRWLGNVHVNTPDSRIVAELDDIMDRAHFEQQVAGGDMTPAQIERWVAAIRRQTRRYALWRHHKNQAEYAWVMGSH